MTFGGFLLLMAMGSLASWGSWVFILSQVDPYETGALGFVLFYATLLVALVGTMTLFGCMYRVWVCKREFRSREVRTSFRHAILLSILAVGFLFLSTQNWLHGWLVVAAIVVMGLVEYLCLLVYDRDSG